MFRKLNLIFLLEFDIVLNKLLLPFSGSFFNLLVLLVKLHLVGECHLSNFEIGLQFLFLVEVDLLEIGTVLVG